MVARVDDEIALSSTKIIFFWFGTPLAFLFLDRCSAVVAGPAITPGSEAVAAREKELFHGIFAVLREDPSSSGACGHPSQAAARPHQNGEAAPVLVSEVRFGRCRPKADGLPSRDHPAAEILALPLKRRLFRPPCAGVKKVFWRPSGLARRVHLNHGVEDREVAGTFRFHPHEADKEFEVMSVLNAVQAAPRGSRSGFGSLAWTVVAAVVALSSVAWGDPLPTSYIYGMDDSSQLWVMGLSGTNAGTAQLIGGSTLTGSSANGLAYDSSREQLFVTDTSTDELYWWQQGATNYTSLGSLAAYTSAGKPQSAAFYNDAYWFMGGGTPGNTLVKLSMIYTSGIPSISGATSYTITDMATSTSGGGDMVITPAGMLYAYSQPAIGNFFSVDLNAIGPGPSVGNYNLIATTPGTGLQLALGTDNATLYGHDFNTGNWYIVDKTNGNTTQIQGFTTTPSAGAGFRDLGGSSIQAVPEPSTMVLAAMGLGIVPWQISRHRKSRGRGDARRKGARPVVLMT